MRTPSFVRVFLELLRMCTAEHRNTVVLVGFSRGAAWVVDLALTDAKLVDAVIAIAPYPWTRQPSDNHSEARQLMQVPVLVLLVHFAEDEFCNAANYGTWFAQFAIAMESAPGREYGQRRPTFLSCMMSGDHAKAAKLFSTLAFEQSGHWDTVSWWRDL